MYEPRIHIQLSDRMSLCGRWDLKTRPLQMVTAVGGFGDMEPDCKVCIQAFERREPVDGSET